MSDDFPAIERNLLRRLDGATDAAPPPLAEEGTATASRPADIGSVLEAVQLTATSMSTMADRIEELEAHTEAFTAANEELETANRRLALELGDAIQQRDALATSLEAKADRLKRLESVTAEQVAKASRLERDVAAAHADLAKIVDAVGGHLGGEGPHPAELPTEG